MIDILITNIKGLVQVRERIGIPLSGASMDKLPILSDAFLMIANGRIEGFGPMTEIPAVASRQYIDATGRYVFPSFVDAHTHLIFPASREEEFEMKIRGAAYSEIAAKGGGILNSARKLNGTSEDTLFDLALQRVFEIARTGTGVVEIKSGYGLSLEGELKMLRVARRLRESVPLEVRTTFLGAHAFPPGKSREDYMNEIIDEMIPAVAGEQLADYIDVFCEDGFFSREETERVVLAGKSFGMKARLHANQLHRSGGVQAGVATGAISVDHLENIGDEEVEILAGSSTIATALPGAAFFLNLPMPPVRTLIDRNVPVVVASDYNPGSCPSGNMPLMLSLACIRMRMTPAEAINAMTVNAACALELENDYGSIAVGKVASVFLTAPIPSLTYLPYAFGSRLIEKVILRGKELVDYAK